MDIDEGRPYVTMAEDALQGFDASGFGQFDGEGMSHPVRAGGELVMRFQRPEKVREVPVIHADRAGFAPYFKKQRGIEYLPILQVTFLPIFVPIET